MNDELSTGDKSGSSHRPKVFFDVDDTLLATGHRLRPFAREVVAQVANMGFEVCIWSGVGLRWEVVDVHGLRPQGQEAKSSGFI
jgi:hypothetical protein